MENKQDITSFNWEQLKKFEDLCVKLDNKTRQLDYTIENDPHTICVNYGAFMTAANHILRTKLPPYIYGSTDIEQEYGIKAHTFENCILDVMQRHSKMSEDFAKLADKYDEVVNKFNALAEKYNKIPVDQRENGINDLPIFDENI